jgi:hypothetical protein
MEVIQLASTIVLNDEEDSLVWQFNTNGVYSSQSLYKVINHRGVLPVYVSAIWSLSPTQSTFFLVAVVKKQKSHWRQPGKEMGSEGQNLPVPLGVRNKKSLVL